MRPDERTVVLRAQAGDRKAFERLFEDHHVRIYNLVRYLLRDQREAEDITQRVFIRAWEELPRLRDPQAFMAWLNRIAANLARDYIRSRPPPTALPEGEEAALGGTEDENVSIDNNLLTAERDEMVHQAIATLPEHHREVVVMHHLEGRAVQDIARALGIAQGTVLSRLARARESLRRKLAPYIEA
ncbi:MAG: RNA polymerase sigma factor [Candidatus Zipacnadales bacterium]